MKADRNANTISLDIDDLQLMTEEITEEAQTSFKTIEEQQEDILGIVTNLLKVLCNEIGDVKIVVDYLSVTTESKNPSET